VSARWTPQDLADYQSRRLGGLTMPRPAKRTISREVKHDYKAEFEQQLSLVGIQFEREFYFAQSRKWRSDWRIQGTKILIEFEGGLFKKRAAGHSSVTGILRDIEKYNAAAIAGWLVIRITPKHVMSGQALKWVEDALRTIGVQK
jgi:very-short-patch-repair endonuclease